MRRLSPITLILAAVIATASPALSSAAEPPNQNDPCAKAGRNTCGTDGVGQYRTYRYGPRWFGDFRKVVADQENPFFCIDLRFWYPSRSFAYEKRSASGLKNRDGESVSASKLRRMAFALWRYGDSDDRTQQGAMMLYVHGLMGDAAPGEAAPDAAGPAVEKRYRAIARDAERLAGPYKVESTVAEGVKVGTESTFTAKVVSASGAAVPGVSVKLGGSGLDGLPATAKTDGKGAISATFTPTKPGTLKITAKAEVAATLPALYVPTRGESARSGQRLVAPATATASGDAQFPVKVTPTVVTQISAQTVTPGTAVTDSVKVDGLSGETVTVTAALYGPFAAADQAKCDGTPVWQGAFTASSDGTYVTEPVTLTTPGYYTYVEWIDDSDRVAAVKTVCGEAAETTVVRGAAAIVTQISAQETAPGAKITDSVVVSGLGVLPATVNVELWGPYPTREAITCQGTPYWTGTFPVPGDGTYTTEAVELKQAGYYTYRESIAESAAYAGVQTACGEATETTFAKAAPKVVTKVSDQVVRPGSALSDRISVTGLGGTPVTIEVELYGPYASRADMDCKGTPYWKGKVEADGDGEVRSPKATVRRSGFYTYVERIAGSDTVTAVETKCGIEAETSLAAPLILTGRGDVAVRGPRARAAQDGVRPTSVSIDGLGVSAPITGSDIDTEADPGALAVPKNIDRVGWWRDGAAPGDSSGTILLAGHVDSKKDGAGAFYALPKAQRGQTVTLRSSDGKSRRYRVSSVRRMPKGELPTSVFTRTGARKLVLVTCGGPFNTATGHYRDNIVVTATPV
ncbi:MAG: sortase [Solirubrobacteraceae bacterium]|nr:sortase [Solirubrobacteraceae bacterium]